ncbi:hypothetical protein [Nitratireductor sp. ZSWI3]|uniref:hypothetical protein n=1 Tax=Nitratireductor sp. ZSWI3 TaxID=2966359 RepID=UPI00214FDA40|nr:hypothetical protein [Nitratireductor sp. ZSWI3]MCR4266023.1 hypothetical protein [Nitratireductor sp. ZSWI3]
MRNAIAFALGTLLLASPLQADAATCGQMQSTVKARGATILRYPSPSRSDLPRYDRFVANSAECQPIFQNIKVLHVPASDTMSCPLFVCSSDNDD